MKKLPDPIEYIKAKALQDAMILKAQQDLITIHEKVVEKIDQLNNEIDKKVGPQGIRGERGPQGPQGEDGLTPDEEAIIRRVQQGLTLPKDGKDGKDGITPVIDHEGIAHTAHLMVMAKIRIPQDGKNADVIDVIKEIQNGKHIKPEHIDGLEQTMRAWSQQFQGGKGYVHGGGDTFIAGTNITITPNTNGTKTISATGGGTPALPFNSIQFNNAGAFGGSSDLTWDGNQFKVSAEPTAYGEAIALFQSSSDISFTDVIIQNNNPNSVSEAQARIRLQTYGDAVQGVLFGKTSLSSGYDGFAYFWNTESTDFVFATSNTERMRITASGSVNFLNGRASILDQPEGGFGALEASIQFNAFDTNSAIYHATGLELYDTGSMVVQANYATGLKINDYSNNLAFQADRSGLVTANQLQFIDGADPVNYTRAQIYQYNSEIVIFWPETSTPMFRFGINNGAFILNNGQMAIYPQNGLSTNPQIIAEGWQINGDGSGSLSNSNFTFDAGGSITATTVHSNYGTTVGGYSGSAMLGVLGNGVDQVVDFVESATGSNVNFKSDATTVTAYIEPATGNALFQKINLATLPTSPSGLSTGDVWCDTTGGLNILKIV